MTLSKPVVATDVGSCSELVGKENGILVPPGDATALAEALARLGGDEGLRQRMGQVSRRRAATEFSWSRAVSEWTSLFERAVAQPSRR